MMYSTRRLLAFGFLLVFALAPAASAQVVVKASPADVKSRTFDPKHAPAEMPKLQPNEAAVTESRFACGVQIEVEITPAPADGGKASMKVTGLTADLKVGVVMWLPGSVSSKIRAHEAGHRDITLAFYKNAEQIAKTIGEKYIGKQVAVDGVEEKDTHPVIQRLANEYCGEYLGQTEVIAEKVQQRYDELTDHGRNRLSEKDAIKRAMDETAKAK
jgi:hypothetical protein